MVPVSIFQVCSPRHKIEVLAIEAARRRLPCTSMLRGEVRCALSKFEVSVSNYLEVSAFNSVCLHEEPVCQGGLPMVNMGNDGKVPDVTREHLQQSLSLACSRSASPAAHSFSAGTAAAQTVRAGT